MAAPESAPPPYSEHDSDSDGEDEDDDDEPSSPTMKLTINAGHSIHGTNNLVPTSPSPLADATKFSTLLLHAINQLNNPNLGATAGNARPRRTLKVDLTINCGITVVGDRNVIGNVGVRPKAPIQNPAGPSAAGTSDLAAVAGAKRKAEDMSSSDGEPAAKRLAADMNQE